MTVRSADVTAIYELLYNPNYTPERSPQGHIEEMTIEGEPAFILMKEGSEYFEVDQPTAIIWNLLDGRKTLKELADEARKQDDTLTEKDVKDAVVSLAEEGLIASTEPELEEKRVELVSAFQLDVRVLKDSSKTLAGFFRTTRKFAKKWEVYIALAIVVLGAILAGRSILEILSNPARLRLFGSTLVGLLFYQIIVLFPVYLVHELSHAAACDYYGGKPRELGTGLYYFATFFYCDTSDSWRLPRRARIMISIAGPLSTLVVGSLFGIMSLFMNPGFGRNVLEVGAFFCFYGSLINFSPVIETDGYYVLTDILNIPNLRDETFAFIRRILLKILRRAVPEVNYTANQRRIFSIYSIGSIGWIVLFGFTTLRLTYFYSLDARHALLNLAGIAARTQALRLTTIAISLGALLYFSFLILGYVLMGSVAYKKIRVRGVKLETIHDKRVSVFLPLPSTLSRERAMQLVKSARAASRKLTRSFSVTWEAPLCVAALKLGKISQSTDQLKKDLMSVERSFKSLHYKFVTKNLRHFSESNHGVRTMQELLNEFANHFPSFEKRELLRQNHKFLERQDTLLEYILLSAFGTIWSIELSPEDYSRLGREMFPDLVAVDLGVIDSNGELEWFKKHTVLGLEALARLSSEVSEETSQVYMQPEIYQATVFIEPLNSRLMFVGRTEGMERSIVWLGGLFLYQAWSGYIKEALYEASLGLRSINLQMNALAEEHLKELSDSDLMLLHQNFVQLEKIRAITEKALTHVKSSYQSAKNFQESIVLQLEEQSYNIGFYMPMLKANEANLEDLKERINDFQKEQTKALNRLITRVTAAAEMFDRRIEDKPPKEEEHFADFFKRITGKTGSRKYSVSCYSELRVMLALAHVLYPVIAASEIVI